MIQDIKPHHLYNQFNKDIKPDDNSIIFSFKKKKVLVKKDGQKLQFPTFNEVNVKDVIYLLKIDNITCFLANDLIVDGYSYEDLWNLRSDEEESKHLLYTVTTAYQLASWYDHNKYCGCCGSKTHLAHDERAIVCEHCGNRIYPKIVPAVIVGVINDDKILLTKYRTGFAHNALIAGFTEIGETLEECVEREVFEEVGLKVKNIRYYKSQPWGFVDDILVGFYCDVDGDTTIHLDRNELKMGEWTKREDIILQPDHLSLTNEMMEVFKKGYEV